MQCLILGRGEWLVPRWVSWAGSQNCPVLWLTRHALEKLDFDPLHLTSPVWLRHFLFLEFVVMSVYCSYNSNAYNFHWKYSVLAGCRWDSLTQGKRKELLLVEKRNKVIFSPNKPFFPFLPLLFSLKIMSVSSRAKGLWPSPNFNLISRRN